MIPFIKEFEQDHIAVPISFRDGENKDFSLSAEVKSALFKPPSFLINLISYFIGPDSISDKHLKLFPSESSNEDKENFFKILKNKFQSIEAKDLFLKELVRSSINSYIEEKN